MYLEKYEQYLGTGERNAAGLDLKTFLEEYNPKLYDTPAHPVRKQHRGPVRSVLCRMIRCNFPYSDRRQDERRNIPYRVRHAKYSLEGSQIAYHGYRL